MNQQQVQQWHVKARALAELYISARYYEKLGTRRANAEDCLRRLMEHLDTDPSRDAQQAWVESGMPRADASGQAAAHAGWSERK